MRRLLALLLTGIMALSLMGCVGDELETEPAKVTTTAKAAEATTAANGETTPDVVVEVPPMELAASIDVNIALGNNSRTITYNQATPLELPDGSVVVQGDLKPTWAYIEDQLGFEIKDITVQDQSASEMMDISAALGFTDATVYGGSSTAEKMMAFGAQGYFINFLDYLDYMPNFGAYLNENPNIKNAITAFDGGVYFIPYAAELDNYARTFNARQEWVTLLLDGDMAGLESESATLDTAYEGYWDRQSTNVIDLQNAAAGGALTRDVALETLITYINDTYPGLATPSDLFLGVDAQYDIDELVALWRVIKLSPNTLSKAATGAVVDGAIITPFFARKAAYREDIFRLANYFGGQRVFGSDSYNARFYLDADGELQFSYAEEGFLEAVDSIANIYSEGLIFSEFSDLSNKDDFRKELYSKDTEEGHQQFGFMTSDWIASTTAANADVVGMLPPVTTTNSDEFVHYIENTRVIKPDGWTISSASTPEEINSALVLFDYFFSEEGNVVQNYGTPNCLEEGEVFTSAAGIEYPKFNQWLLDTADELKSGDVSGFLRDFMGSQIPIGYQKEIGFELQYTVNHGWEAWALHEDANVLSSSYGASDPYYLLVPPVFSLTEQDSALLNTLAVGEDQVDQIFLFITGASGALGSIEEISDLYAAAGIEEYVTVYRAAYNRMIGK